MEMLNKDLRIHAPGWDCLNLPKAQPGCWDNLQSSKETGGLGYREQVWGVLSFPLTPRYLSCCVAGSHLPLSMSHPLEPPPAHSA